MGPASTFRGAASVGRAYPAQASGCVHVLMVAAVRLVREGISQALGQHAGFEVVGTARASADAVERLWAANPDVSLVDSSLPPGRAAWLYAYPQGRRRGEQGTPRRLEAWLRSPFPEVAVGDDTRFLWAARPGDCMRRKITASSLESSTRPTRAGRTRATRGGSRSRSRRYGLASRGDSQVSIQENGSIGMSRRVSA